MTFGSEGVIQDPTVELLRDTINILIGGGRVFKINNFYEGVTRFNFNDLCDVNLGGPEKPKEYL